MKKFLAVMFAMIFALSCFGTLAFAEQNNHCTCDYCGAEFTTTEELLKHVSEMNKVPDHKVVCAYCGNTFTSNTLLKGHEAVTINDAGLIVCDNAKNGCKETFTNKAAYEAHMEECEFKSVWTLLKAGKIKEGLKLVDWKGIWATVKPILDKVIGAVKGIDLSGVIGTVKNLLSKIPFDAIIGWVKGIIAK